MPQPSAEPAGPGRPETPLRRHATFVLLALAYLSVWPYFERLNNPNENVRVWMTRAIVEYGTLNIDRVTAEWGYVNDKATARGHLYSSKAPGASFLGVPVLWAQTRLWHAAGWASPGKQATTLTLRFFTVMVPALLFLYFFARWLERRTSSAAARDLLLVGVGAGTMLYPYGVLFVGHAQATMAGFASFMVLAWNPAPPAVGRAGMGVGRLAAAGALAGAAVVLEYQLLLIAALLTGYAAWATGRRALWLLAGALPFALALGLYHTALFGRPWEFPYGHLENQAFAQAHGTGYHGLAGPRLAALGASLFSIRYGLFAFSPFLLLGLLLGGRAAWAGRGRVRAEGLLALSAMLVMTLFISGLKNPPGWCVGPRYIAGVVPFLALGLASTWTLWGDGGSPRRELARAVIAGLVISSLFANALSAAVYPHYPEVFDNPLHDLTLPLVRDGYVAYGLGWALGLPQAWSLLPLALFLGGAVVLAVAGHARDRRQALARLAGAALVALLFCGAVARYGRAPAPAQTTAAATVRALWQPAPAPTQR